MSKRRRKGFQAKYKGHCESCDDKIIPGQTIYFVSSGSKPIHVSCGTKEAQPKVKASRAKPPEISPESHEVEQAYNKWDKEGIATRRRSFTFCGNHYS